MRTYLEILLLPTEPDFNCGMLHDTLHEANGEIHRLCTDSNGTFFILKSCCILTKC